DPPAQPPASLYAFCRHFTRGAEPWLLLMVATTGLIALAEVSLYAYVGSLVDRMGALGVAGFLAQEGPRLAWMAALVLVGLPRSDPPAQPPASLYAFCRHFTRGAEPWLLLMVATTGLIALAEVSLYAYVGSLVDRMGALGVAGFLAQEGPRLAWMAALVLVGLP